MILKERKRKWTKSMPLWDALAIIHLSISHGSKCFLLRQWSFDPEPAGPRRRWLSWIKHRLKVPEANPFDGLSLQKHTDAWIRNTSPLQLQHFPQRKLKFVGKYILFMRQSEVWGSSSSLQKECEGLHVRATDSAVGCDVMKEAPVSISVSK